MQIGERIVASLTVRNLPEEAKQRFRQIAAAHGRSMEEHLRQLVIEADFRDAAVPSHVAEKSQAFSAQQPDDIPAREDLVTRLLKIADGAGVDASAFDTGRNANIRSMTAKDAIAELRRLAGGVSLPETPRLNTRLEAPEF